MSGLTGFLAQCSQWQALCASSEKLAGLRACSKQHQLIALSPLVKPRVSCCREAWIREQMAKRLGQALGEAEQMHPDDELYAVPKDLQVGVYLIRQPADVLVTH